MAQHDYVIDNASGATVRADINSALSAIQSLNSGTSEPSSTAAGMLWLDTTGGAPYALKVRDAGNNHWLTLASVTDPGSDGNIETSATIKGTIDSTAVFPTGIPITSSYLQLDGSHSGGSTAYQYSSSGTVVTCTNITLTINKKISSSRIIVHYSIPFQLYTGLVSMSHGFAWFSRTAPTASDFGKTKLYQASELDSTSQALNLYFNTNNQFLDTSTATGDHTYVFKIDRDGTTSSGTFGTRPDGDNVGFIHAIEIM